MMSEQGLLDSRADNIDASAQNELGWGDHPFIYRGWQRLGKFIPTRFRWLLSPRFLRFCAVGLSGIVVNMGMLYALTELCGLFYMFSSPIAIECSFLSNFFLNDVWTWKGVGDPRATERLKRLGKFHVVYAAGLAINLSLLYVVTEHLGLYYLLANLIAIAVATMWNFWWSARWTWSSL
jgi:dolichol-phosphate mannosyltransferase